MNAKLDIPKMNDTAEQPDPVVVRLLEEVRKEIEDERKADEASVKQRVETEKAEAAKALDQNTRKRVSYGLD